MGPKAKTPKKGAAPPKQEPPDYLIDLDTVYVRTSKTNLKVQPKAELINEPPSMNAHIGLDPRTGKQLYTIHYKKPIIPPSVADANVETDRPRLLYIKPAEIIARFSCIGGQDDEMLPILFNVPQEGKYIVAGEPKILRYGQSQLMRDLDESLMDEEDESDESD
uniref:Uncharacterized protein n=1 Tax=Cacopsylla melanoneura TaxID=428564 RepID=A0A8D9FJK5_9HEMI